MGGIPRISEDLRTLQLGLFSMEIVIERRFAFLLTITSLVNVRLASL
jgi:hypothetical protein